MKKVNNTRIYNKIYTAAVIGILVLVPKMNAYATSVNEVQNEINNTQAEIERINERLESLSDEQDLIQEKIDDLNAEIINTMTSISVKEEEISEKDSELATKEADIAETEKTFYAAKAEEESRYEDMVIRLKNMYEYNGKSILSYILQGKGLQDMLNRMDYVEDIYAYDKQKYEELILIRQAVADMWERLKQEKAALEEEKAILEKDRQDLEDQKANLDVMLAKKKRESANYDAEIAKYKKDAENAKNKLKKEQQKLKQLQSAANAKNMTFTATDYTKVIDNATGSELGKQIAKYACQYIGNPYVMGGTSLTNGADCSGFIYRIYSDFGYTLPRTSYEQRSAGTGVDYSAACPGDIICYDGHVGMYIGSGYIVHASSAKTGIKVSKAGYRSILSVRRIVN